ncbi:MAG: hypothetical protein Q7U04_16510 [Bacteriovorax sp.]|nr:hypothetical protein [Bacteriovorax sp.]
MSKLKSNKHQKSHLTVEDKKLGKVHVYILIAMIAIGIAIALFNMQ